MWLPPSVPLHGFGLLTGKYPTRSRDGLLSALMFLNDKERGIQKGETIFPALLRKGSYHTALIGKWHLGHGNKGFLPTRHGFNEFIGHTGGCIDFYTMRYGIEPDWYHGEKHVDESGYATELITDEAVDFLKRQKKSRPFFLHLAYNAPHFGKGYDPGKEQANGEYHAATAKGLEARKTHQGSGATAVRGHGGEPG